MKRHYVSVSVVGWIGLLLLSAMWNIWQTQRAQEEQHLHVARSFFGLIVTMREWNALMGGVYAPISEHLQPNPYLDVPRRELYPPGGPVLTRVNPAYMTRLIAALAQEKQGVQFHITSLEPVNPNNRATAWETEALLTFEQQASEFSRWDRQAATFSYMAPLVTQEPCLVCHAKDGYELGDIRGGISITFAAPPINLWPILLSHSIITVVGLVAIRLAGQKLTQAFRELELRSQLDGLTYVFNRGYFDARLRQEFSQAQRHAAPYAIILADVDHFKAYNDLYGHPAGDSCLQTIARTLKLLVRQTDGIVARYGGEEFVFILPNTTPSVAHAFAERVRLAVEALAMRNPGGGGNVTLSLGVATWEVGDRSAKALLDRADRALYAAKQGGRNQVVYAHECESESL